MPRPPWSQLGLHVIAKPIGPICNLACDYCFYLPKRSLYADDETWRMSDDTLRAFVRQYIEAQPESVDQTDFAFQGGEPTLLGIDFFRRVVELQQEYAPPGKRIHNSLQTNGLLLDDRWCEFLKQHGFLVGLSIDGPAELHDRFRRDRQGCGTFDRVVRAMQLLLKHSVEFNTLTCVHRHNADRPGRVYRFLRDVGVGHMQFIPVVERLADSTSDAAHAAVSSRSVRPGQFGRFLTGVFDAWIANDVGRVFVRDFDQALSAWVGAGATVCIYAKHCGRAVAIEHNGDLFSCDHFVDETHKLGNIHQVSIAKLANASSQEAFGLAKEQTLPACCRRCDYLFACNGACPKDRFLPEPDGSGMRNYLCEGYRIFFAHIAPFMKAMATEVSAGRPAAGVMQQLRAQRQATRQTSAPSGAPVRRNAPCPCGSGKKFKSCCMRR